MSAEPISTFPAHPNYRGYNSCEIPEIWDTARPLILKGLERGSNYSIGEIYQGLLSAEMQLWMWGHDAALVTTIQSDESKTWLLLLVCGGKNMHEWLPFMPYVEAFARLNHATELRIYGRIGWARILGFSVDYARMSKCLADRET